LSEIVEANIDGETMSKVSAKTIQVAVADLNGILRGKILPSKNAKKLKNKSIRLPLSALNVDLLGEDIENSPLVFESGDTDGYIQFYRERTFSV